MKTYNGISGGKTSAYLEEHYPADILASAIVRIEKQEGYDVKWMNGKEALLKIYELFQVDGGLSVTDIFIAKECLASCAIDGNKLAKEILDGLKKDD